MSNIRIDVGYTIKDGTEIKFRSPVDCSAITGLIVYYPGADGNTTSKVFALADAHGNNVGNIDHLFAENVVVKVILDVTTSMAFVQNADTNAYLEAQFAKKAPAGVGFGENMLSRSSSGNTSTMATSGESLESFQAKVDAQIATMENYSAKLMLVRGVSSLGNFYSNCGNCLGILYRAGSADEAWLIALSHQAARGSKWSMRKGGGTWSDPEWEHPPMVAGTEYRTTERYNEKPVYAKAVNCGAAPKNTRKNVAHGISNLDFVVSVSGCMTDPQSINALPTEWSDGSKCSVAAVNATNITIQSNVDFSAATVYVLLKYTKA